MSGERRAGSLAKDEQLLALLRARAGQFVSGSELARALGVSRAAVGKRVAALREQGFEIEAVHNRGYRLAAEADPVDAATLGPQLTTRWLGRVYLVHRSLPSTSDEAARLAEDGAPHGTLVLAEAQQSGRGRLGRGWHSPPRLGLYLSAVLRPRLEPTRAPLLSLAAAVAVAEAVRGFVGRPPAVKWPNDLLYAGRKVAGILLEMSAEPGQLRHVVLGVGLNVNHERFPAQLEATATSLRLERGSPVRRAPVLAALLHALERWVELLESEGSAPVLAAWRELADFIGKPVAVSVGPGSRLAGIARGIDAGGALQLELADGRVETIAAGDVSLR